MSTGEVLLRAAVVLLIFPVGGYLVAEHLEQQRHAKALAGVASGAVAIVLVVWLLATNL